MASGGLSMSEDGLVWEHIDQEESDFLYHEIFVRNIYEGHGVTIRNCDVIVDCGANIGLFSIHCTNLNSNCKVLAIEPLPPIYEVLKRNTRTRKVHTIDCGISSVENSGRYCDFIYFPRVPGESTMFLEEQLLKARLIEDALQEYADKDSLDESELDQLRGIHSDSLRYSCPVYSLQHIFESEKEYLGERIDLLKIDIEGDELGVLRGIGDVWWPRIRQVTMEVFEIDNRVENTINFLRSMGFASVACELSSVEVSEDGYLHFTPPESRLYHVYAR